MAPPGKGLRGHRLQVIRYVRMNTTSIGRLSTEVTLNQLLLISRETSVHLFIVMILLPLSNPPLEADESSELSSSSVGHAEKRAFSDYQPVCPRQRHRYPYTTPPLPQEEARSSALGFT